MKFAVIGGDRRTELLCAMLAGDGHKVYTYALEKAEKAEGVIRAGCLQGCVYGADYVLLPIPTEQAGMLNAPLSAEEFSLSQIIDALWEGQTVCGGAFCQDVCLQGANSGLFLEDILRRPSFAYANAELTAECALGLLMRNTDKALGHCRVLICGWGRIGMLLALKLKALGAAVTVASRSRVHGAQARALGLQSCDYAAAADVIGEQDFIVNTSPARVLDEAALCAVSERALLLELASPPGGYDRTLCANLGLNSVYAPGLPGKHLPYSAAAIIRDAIYEIMEEQEERG